MSVWLYDIRKADSNLENIKMLSFLHLMTSFVENMILRSVCQVRTCNKKYIGQVNMGRIIKIICSKERIISFFNRLGFVILKLIYSQLFYLAVS